MTNENWEPIWWLPGSYLVSDQGRVKSLGHRSKGGRILRPVGPPNSRYYKVSIRSEGRKRQVYIHTLVAKAFMGFPEPGMVVRHLNGDAFDNRLCNLAYGTIAENNQDTVRHGHHRSALKTHCPQGHEYTPENTYRYGRNRMCKACIRAGQRARYQAKKRKGDGNDA